MTSITKRWYRSRRILFFLCFASVLGFLLYVNGPGLSESSELDVTRRYIESTLLEALKEDKGMGCDIPKLDPFDKEVTQFDHMMPKIVCPGQDWVRCHLSECQVVKEILETTTSIVCYYKDIIYHSDNRYGFGPPVRVDGDGKYILNKSDHVKVMCSGKHRDNILPSKWIGFTLGFRPVSPPAPPPGRERTANVLILGFDSTSKNGFIRRMPKSYEVLTKHLGANVLNGYNIVGDGTPAALFPILTGKTELELPEARKSQPGAGHLDDFPFIFYKLRDDGYRTAYFEDMPWIGTFQYRFNGFLRQPADHYLRAFYTAESFFGKKWTKAQNRKYCIGDTPQYALMLNMTKQFHELPGKKFSFSFIADITHDNFNMISTSDEDVARFLTEFKAAGHLQNTLLIVMGDHGPRYANVRETLAGKLEERLPLMALVLPDTVKRARPMTRLVSLDNADRLTTPHDIHATLLDVMDMKRHTPRDVLPGADLPRAISLLEPIPQSRSCSEAYIEPHWCACLRLIPIDAAEPQHAAAAAALLAHLNRLTDEHRSLCQPRTLTSVEWVMRQKANKRLLEFAHNKDPDGYLGSFNAIMNITKENYQVKIVVGPGRGVYEASLRYDVAKKKFDINTRDISRINAYNNEPACISSLYPHLNPFCYCK